jgi:hypothetical protein
LGHAYSKVLDCGGDGDCNFSERGFRLQRLKMGRELDALVRQIEIHEGLGIAMGHMAMPMMALRLGMYPERFRMEGKVIQVASFDSP